MARAVFEIGRVQAYGGTVAGQVVVNARKEPVGLVDSQDLPKLKLM